MPTEARLPAGLFELLKGKLLVDLEWEFSQLPSIVTLIAILSLWTWQIELTELVQTLPVIFYSKLSSKLSEFIKDFINC